MNGSVKPPSIQHVVYIEIITIAKRNVCLLLYFCDVSCVSHSFLSHVLVIR